MACGRSFNQVNINFAETEHLSHYSHLSILSFYYEASVLSSTPPYNVRWKILGNLEYLFKISSTAASAGILGKQVKKFKNTKQTNSCRGLQTAGR